MLIETETTPNPATLKFLPGRIVMEAGTRDFATPEEAEASPLAEMLLAGDVKDGDTINVSAGVEGLIVGERISRSNRERPAGVPLQ